MPVALNQEIGKWRLEQHQTIQRFLPLEDIWNVWKSVREAEGHGAVTKLDHLLSCFTVYFRFCWIVDQPTYLMATCIRSFCHVVSCPGTGMSNQVQYSRVILNSIGYCSQANT